MSRLVPAFSLWLLPRSIAWLLLAPFLPPSPHGLAFSACRAGHFSLAILPLPLAVALHRLTGPFASSFARAPFVLLLELFVFLLPLAWA